MENISFLIDSHIWAHNKVLQQLQEITPEEWNKAFGGSFPSLHEVFKHMVSADYRWLQRWKGVSLAPIPDTFLFDNYTQLNATWQPILADLKATAADYLSTAADKPLTFTTASGACFTMPFWQTLYQVVNHGTYHRGQVTNMLRQLGKQPVGTDIFLFFAEKEKAQ
ncbi:MAG TPA: DinB family protein [Chitinophagaceae bacterium]|nr:DinB family protein [Chitinophagaceae bacterium]